MWITSAALRWAGLLLPGMEDDGFYAPAALCERCGGEYQLTVVRTVRGPVTVEVCPMCDLGAIALSK